MGIQISFSAYERYLLSPFSYYAHYLLRLRAIQASSPLIFGAAIDDGINCLLEIKQKCGEINPGIIVTAKELFRNSLLGNISIDYRTKGIVKFSKADLDESLIEGLVIPEEHNRAWYSLEQKGYAIIDAYAEQVIPKLDKVLLVQHKLNLTNKNGDTFVGIVDLVATINGKNYLIDNKTASKKYAKDAVEQSAQLGTYFEILKDSYNLAGSGYIVIPKNLRKKKLPLCEIDIQLGNVKEEVIHETFIQYDKVLDGIKNAKFPCTPEKCTKTFWPCPYEAFCRSGGCDITGLKYMEKK